MPITRSKTDIGILLSEKLSERSLSMRKLSELTGVDTATISRISSGKRQATLQHLSAFANSLEVPIKELLEAAGYPVEEKESLTENKNTVEAIKNMMKKSNLVDNTFSDKEVEEQLSIYGEESQTEKGTNAINQDFLRKIKEIGSVGPFITDLNHLFERFRHRKGSARQLTLIGGALLYFITPIDIIPDYLFAVGYLDDVIIVQFAMNTLVSN